jgi:hypothetical protein
MAGKVFFSVSMSLDGFIAPESLEGFIAPGERRDDPDVQRWMAQWMELQQWIFPQRFFREGPDGVVVELPRQLLVGPGVAGAAAVDLDAGLEVIDAAGVGEHPAHHAGRLRRRVRRAGRQCLLKEVAFMESNEPFPARRWSP